MTDLSYAFGSLLIVLGLADVFVTVLHYDASSVLLRGFYAGTWRIVRLVSGPLPGYGRSLVRSFAAPLMVVGTIGSWLIWLIIGFSLVYLPGVTDGQFAVGRLGKSYATALYLSASSVSSLSFSDVEPRTLMFHVLTAVETIVGLAVLTMAVTFMLGLYGVLEQRGELAARLYHHASNPSEPLSLLDDHFQNNGEAFGLDTEFRALHLDLISYYEGLRRYPVLYYFQSRQVYRSLPYLFWFAGSSIAALQWGLPDGHPAHKNPWLAGFLRGYSQMVRSLDARFLHGVASNLPPSEMSREEFLGARANKGERDELLELFFESESYVRRLAGLEASPDLDESYKRYHEWREFVSVGRAFVDGASHDLGVPPPRRVEDPMARLF